ncbi:MAG TPA: hypothetical protein VMC84_05580 [Methanocella sp.]|uniref:hypothetical protein n=1 Tax=Methanocella sp. TaxID=2052833 RepID=UPI002BDAC19E|nr:hypothetical protein [Methanocella sp.]HTY90630.1 hypothetical protein [Methanocella sp.]
MVAFMPGASPPLVTMPMAFKISPGIISTAVLNYFYRPSNGLFAAVLCRARCARDLRLVRNAEHDV